MRRRVCYEYPERFFSFIETNILCFADVAEMAEDDLDLFLSKLALSPHQKWNLETVDLVFEMFKISTDGPVYEDGDLI